mgnify:CR=1 FL=1
MIKGGVWKNTEDEILKAAVMKYGKNQWARIASLLTRKSAKQCKARWYEWLDPSIKKTEWTREEEEKLLHLAKLMPTQWRTIAPIVGRTAAQCLQHYEKLLDSAQEKGEGDDEGLVDDPRRLRPGEIDPNPETKPARPDPIDMDEDELEMLSEARARLANTMGKKAKRKAREKQINEAKRLAKLQKMRELSAAGIRQNGRRNGRKRRLDYNDEIPFHKRAPAGFYDVSDEASRKPASAAFQATLLNKLEEQRRDAAEAKARIKDRERHKKLKKMNLPFAVKQISKANDPINSINRGKLVLPAPVVSEDELAEIAKSGDAEATQALLAAGGSTATQTLLGNYEATPGATPGRGVTPLRTPQRPAGQDVVQEEIRNAIARTNQQTPLQGGENLQLAAGTGFEGHNPATPQLRTPSSLASGTTPVPGSASATPSRIGGATPMRDSLGINTDGSDSSALMTVMDPSRQRREEAARLAELRRGVQSGLSALPAPHGNFAVRVPVNVDDDEDGKTGSLELDAADVDAKREALARRKRQEELKKRSTAIQKALPRPRKINKHLDTDGRSAAETAILRGASDAMHVDHVLYPDESKGKSRKAPSAKKLASLPVLDTFTKEQLLLARQLIQQETQASATSQLSAEEFDQLWSEVHGGAKATTTPAVVFLPSQNKFGRWSAASQPDRVATLRMQYNQVCELMAKTLKRAEKLTETTQRRLAGYQRRAADVVRQRNQTVEALVQKEAELKCFQHLYHLERQAKTTRLQTAKRKLDEEVCVPAWSQQLHFVCCAPSQEETPRPSRSPFRVDAKFCVACAFADCQRSRSSSQVCRDDARVRAHHGSVAREPAQISPHTVRFSCCDSVVLNCNTSAAPFFASGRSP